MSMVSDAHGKAFVHEEISLCSSADRNDYCFMHARSHADLCAPMLFIHDAMGLIGIMIMTSHVT